MKAKHWRHNIVAQYGRRGRTPVLIAISAMCHNSNREKSVIIGCQSENENMQFRLVNFHQ